MKGIIFLFLIFNFLNVNGQDDETYLKKHAVRIDNPEKLSESIYTLLSPFQIIMIGEMHGTNESAPFVRGLTNLFTQKGDCVLVGLEIPPTLMTLFTSQLTDSSIYQSEFFNNPPFIDGRESFPWANLISTLNKNNLAKIFFFDVNPNEGKAYERDSLMAEKIITQYKQHPVWKLITLSGNYHNRITNPMTMASVLKRNLSVKICSLNMEYKGGSCNANFKNGLEIKQLGSQPTVYNSTSGYNQYLILLSENTDYDYNGFYYTKNISPAKMTFSK